MKHIITSKVEVHSHVCDGTFLYAQKHLYLFLFFQNFLQSIEPLEALSAAQEGTGQLYLYAVTEVLHMVLV